jgi:prepilin-type N-terminal cleavage/methylation domain-containing protein
MINQKTYAGFTIVELLVVIVVIGVLATISIVSYVGISSEAAVSVIKSDLKNASTKLGLMNATDGLYPLTDADLPRSNGTTYQYVTHNNGYCLGATSTAAGEYYHILSADGTIKDGACNYSQSLVSGLVSYWSLDEASGVTALDTGGSNNGSIKINAVLMYPFDGNANDTSISARNGTVNGATLTTDRFGNLNSAYSLNGTSNYISMPAMTLSNKYFISAWVKRDPSASSWNTIVGGKSTAANNLAYNSDGRIAFGNFSGGWAAIGGNILTDTDNWHHIVAAVTSDGTNGTWSLYVDGVFIGTSGSIVCDGNFTAPRIGSYSNGSGAWFKGSVDEVLIGSTNSNLPNSVDISRLYDITSLHDMNKPYIEGQLSTGLDLWGYSSSANNSVMSYIDMGTNFNSVVNGVATPFTLSFWTYKYAGSGSSSHKQFGWYGGNYKGAYFGITDGGALAGTIGRGNTTGSNSNHDFSVGVGAADNSWHHIAVTYDGVDVKAYFNGSSVYTYNIGAFVDNGNGTQKLIVNRNPWDFYAASQGRYDELAAWSRALTPAEISNIYNSGQGLSYP